MPTPPNTNKLTGAAIVGAGIAAATIGLVSTRRAMSEFAGVPDMQAAFIAMGMGMTYIGGVYAVAGAAALKREFSL